MAKRGRKKTSRRAAARPAAGSLGKVSTTDLAREMQRRQRAVGKLQAKRDKLLGEIQAIDAELAAMGGAARGVTGMTAAGRPRKRPANEMPLADKMVEVLNGHTMGVSELAEAVQAAGYQTSSASFRTIVNQTLLKDKRFKKVARGQYTVK